MARLTDEVFGGIYGNGSGNSPVRDIFWFHLWTQCYVWDTFDDSDPSNPQCYAETGPDDNRYGVMKLIHTWSDEEDTDYSDDDYTFYDFNDVGLCYDAVRDAYPNEPPSSHQYCFGDAEYGVNDPFNP